MADVSAPKGEFRNKSMDVPVDELIPFCSCICFITSCYTEWPECFGCAGKRVFLMFYDEFLACKIPPEGDEKWFMCLKGYSYWAPVKVLCMNRSHICCVENRCAYPFAEDIPMLVTCCFFTVYVKEKFGPYACYKTVKELGSV